MRRWMKVRVATRPLYLHSCTKWFPQWRSNIGLCYGRRIRCSDEFDFEDDTLPEGSITFANGATEQTIAIVLSGDQDAELDERFSVRLWFSRIDCRWGACKNQEWWFWGKVGESKSSYIDDVEKCSQKHLIEIAAMWTAWSSWATLVECVCV